MVLRDVSKPRSFQDGSQPSQSGSEQGRTTRSKPGPLLGRSIINDGKRGKPFIATVEPSPIRLADNSPSVTTTPGPASTARDPRPHHGVSPSNQNDSAANSSATSKFNSIMADIEKKANPDFVPLSTGSRDGRPNDF